MLQGLLRHDDAREIDWDSSTDAASRLRHWRRVHDSFQQLPVGGDPDWHALKWSLAELELRQEGSNILLKYFKQVLDSGKFDDGKMQEIVSVGDVLLPPPNRQGSLVSIVLMNTEGVWSASPPRFLVSLIEACCQGNPLVLEDLLRESRGVLDDRAAASLQGKIDQLAARSQKRTDQTPQTAKKPPVDHLWRLAALVCAGIAALLALYCAFSNANG